MHPFLNPKVNNLFSEEEGNRKILSKFQKFQIAFEKKWVSVLIKLTLRMPDITNYSTGCQYTYCSHTKLFGTFLLH